MINLSKITSTQIKLIKIKVRSRHLLKMKEVETRLQYSKRKRIKDKMYINSLQLMTYKIGIHQELKVLRK